jgi:hypothetical protein
MADWFTSLANQAIQYADSIADSLVDQANQAQEQLVSEQRKLQEESAGSGTSIDKNALLMPWETNDESKAILSQALMEKILNLSMVEENFTTVPPNSDDVKAKEEWNFGDFVPVAMRLMEIDINLSRSHAKVSPKIKGGEEEFWFRYYARILYLRASSGIDGALSQQNSLKWKEEEIVYLVSEQKQSQSLFGGLQHLKNNSASSNDSYSPADTPKENPKAADKHKDPSKPSTPSQPTATETPAAAVVEKDKIEDDESVSISDEALGEADGEGADDEEEDEGDELDLDDLDDMDLGDDDLDDDYENVGEDDDLELEAAIAKELAADGEDDEN